MIDLTQFCSTDETRAVLMKPNTRAGFHFATDGRIIVRIQSQGTDTFGNDAKYPDAISVFPWNHADLPSDSWRPLTQEMRCVSPIDCETCFGSGRAECNYGHEHECPDCEGKGHYVPTTPMTVYGVLFSRFYVHKMCQLPNCEMWIPKGMSDEKPVPIRFDGGLGYLMQMRRNIISATTKEAHP